MAGAGMGHAFPSEFSQLFRRGLYRKVTAEESLRDRRGNLCWVPNPFGEAGVARAISGLERHMRAFLRPMTSRVPRSSILEMTEAASEKLPKVVRCSSILLHNRRSEAYGAARSIGLIDTMTSPSLHKFAENRCGYKLDPAPDLQILCYDVGDYVGPHNDNHPEDADLRRGYVDLQITLSNEYVAGQNLIYEDRGHLNRMENVGIRSGVSVARLPFWHQVTPLAGRKGGRARRWLLLASFNIDR